MSDADGFRLEAADAAYGDVKVLHSVDLAVCPGEVVALVGPNGAGKSTAARSLMGLVRLTRGRVLIDGQDVTRTPPWTRARMGIGSVPERRQVFGELTVTENLLVGLSSVKPAPPRKDVQERFEEAFARFPILRDRRNVPAGLLSGGQQQMLAIARALVSRPRYVILDEPSLGLAPAIVEELFEMIAALSESAGVLILEQNVNASLAIADRGVVLAAGTIVAEGPGDSLRGRADLVELFLGSESSFEASAAADRDLSRLTTILNGGAR